MTTAPETERLREEVLIDNSRVRVTRLTVPPGTEHEPAWPCGDRLVIAITHHKVGSEHAGELITFKPGDVVFRPASHHRIRNHSAEPHQVVIVELKEDHEAEGAAHGERA